MGILGTADVISRLQVLTMSSTPIPLITTHQRYEGYRRYEVWTTIGLGGCRGPGTEDSWRT
jgi:hypothetical protein